MSLQKGLEQIEHLERTFKGKSHSRKWMKKFRNRWLRRINKKQIPNTKIRKGYEY